MLDSARVGDAVIVVDCAAKVVEDGAAEVVVDGAAGDGNNIVVGNDTVVSNNG